MHECGAGASFGAVSGHHRAASPRPTSKPLPLKTTAFVSHEDGPRHDTGWSHPDHQGRLPGIVRAVYRDMVALFEPLLEVEAVPATVDDLLLVHTPAHVERVRAASARAQADGAVLEVDGVKLSGASWDAALAAAGAGITAAGCLLRGDARNAFCLVRPSGRGARPDSAGGFSLFDNVGITARRLRRSGTGRVLIVDLGVRPSTTARTVAGDDGIACVSVHQHTTSVPVGDGDVQRPGSVPPERWIAVHPGSSGAELGDALRSVLDAIPPAEEPDIVLLALDLGILAGDPFGGLAVTPDEVYGITRVIRDWADAHARGRLVSILDGGYAPDGLGRAVVQHLRALTGLQPA